MARTIPNIAGLEQDLVQQHRVLLLVSRSLPIEMRARLLRARIEFAKEMVEEYVSLTTDDDEVKVRPAEKSAKRVPHKTKSKARSSTPQHAPPGPTLRAITDTSVNEESSFMDVVRAVLARHPQGLRTKEVFQFASEIRSDITNQNVSVALYQLNKDGMIAREGETTRSYVYRLKTSPEKRAVNGGAH